MGFWRKVKETFTRPCEPPPPVEKRNWREKRLATRRSPRFVHAYIWSEQMAASKPCHVRNLSISGARLDLFNGAVKTQMLTGLLTLYFPDEKHEIDCEVMRRIGRSLGVRFVGSYRVPTRKYGAG
jgi:hypothetical protein